MPGPPCIRRRFTSWPVECGIATLLAAYVKSSYNFPRQASTGLRTEQAGSGLPRVPEQRTPDFRVLTRCRQDLHSTGGRRSGFCRVCSVRPTVPCAMHVRIEPRRLALIVRLIEWRSIACEVFACGWHLDEFCWSVPGTRICILCECGCSSRLQMPV